MYVALSAKNKLGFIDGSIPKPEEGDPTYSSWIKCNYMVLAWISNSLSPDIANYALYADSAAHVWRELKRRFSRTSNNRIYMLEQQLISTKQDGSAVSIYFAKLKSIWDEISVYEEACVCTANPCGALTTMNKRRETRRVMQFLMGLDESYITLRNQVLLRETLPDLDDVFNLVIQEEANNELSSMTHHPADSAAMMVKGDISEKQGGVHNLQTAAAVNMTEYVQRNNQKGNFKPWVKNPQTKPKMVCSKCGKNNHTIETCYEIYGYPPGHRYSKFKSQAMGNRFSHHMANQSSVEESNDQKNIALTQDQVQQLMFLLQGSNIKPNQSSISSKSVSNEFTSSGSRNLEEDWDS
ncbi:Unknown protein [Striga hermonthica]|uniref:Retrotransposon gag domain-containing protein n=1 Tax=Striga hermonthica TaxID=68872 RepID=A0A9N7RPR3_STRHE|nr:Unknown protein [Striga hermonthica]